MKTSPRMLGGAGWRRWSRFLFRATGETGIVENMSTIDVYDNLLQELDRLRAVADLMASSKDDLDSGSVGGVAAILRDVEERMREILRLAVNGPKRKMRS